MKDDIANKENIVNIVNKPSKPPKAKETYLDKYYSKEFLKLYFA